MPAARLVAKGTVNSYKYAVFEYSEKDLRAVRPEACKALAEELEAIGDLPEDVVEGLRRCDEEAWERAREELEDTYIPSFDEKAAEILINRGRPSDVPEAQVLEEAGYGVPEYSLYQGADVRGWVGRWTTDEHFLADPEGICYALARTHEECERIVSVAERHLGDRPRGTHRAFLVWEAR